MLSLITATTQLWLSTLPVCQIFEERRRGDTNFKKTKPRLVDQWINHADMTDVMYSGPLGQESGNAIDDVIFGVVNSSGKIIHTIAKNESDYDSNTQVTEDVDIDFSEGNYIDYKYFDAYNITPRYEFRYCLSYTTSERSTNAMVAANTTALSEACATSALAMVNERSVRRR